VHVSADECIHVGLPPDVLASTVVQSGMVSVEHPNILDGHGRVIGLDMVGPAGPLRHALERVLLTRRRESKCSGSDFGNRSRVDVAIYDTALNRGTSSGGHLASIVVSLDAVDTPVLELEFVSQSIVLMHDRCSPYLGHLDSNPLRVQAEDSKKQTFSQELVVVFSVFGLNGETLRLRDQAGIATRKNATSLEALCPSIDCIQRLADSVSFCPTRLPTGDSSFAVAIVTQSGDTLAWLSVPINVVPTNHRPRVRIAAIRSNLEALSGANDSISVAPLSISFEDDDNFHSGEIRMASV